MKATAAKANMKDEVCCVQCALELGEKREREARRKGAAAFVKHVNEFSATINWNCAVCANRETDAEIE